MKYFTPAVQAGIIGFSVLLASFATANAATLSIQSLSPGATVSAGDSLSFKIVGTDFLPTLFTISDSLATTSSLSNSNVSPSGNVVWIPLKKDVGTHTITIEGSDGSTNANVTQTIVVSPAPSLSVGALTPGAAVPMGTKLTFTVSAPGFTNPTYIVGDSFIGATLSSANIDSSGNFSWTPSQSDNGTHTITIYGSDPSGHHASVDVTIQAGAGPSLSILSLAPASASVAPGGTISFMVGASNFSPSSFSVSDSFSGASTVSNANINTSGSFSWVPASADIGTHVLTVTGKIGLYGQGASTTLAITVLGAGSSPASTSSAPTAASTGVSALQAQLALLQAQIAAQSGSTASTTASSTVSDGYVFKLFLETGNRGAEVLALQKRLVTLGFLTAKPTGYFGSATEKAVKQFQIAHGIRAAGYVGPATRAALNHQ